MRFICGVPYNTTFSKHKSVKEIGSKAIKK